MKKIDIFRILSKLKIVDGYFFVDKLVIKGKDDNNYIIEVDENGEVKATPYDSKPIVDTFKVDTTKVD